MIFVDPNMPIEEQKQILTNHVEHMQMLLRNPGWEALDAYFKQEEAAAFTHMQSAKNGDEAMKAIGAYTAISNMRSLPHRSLAAAVEAVASLSRK